MYVMVRRVCGFLARIQELHSLAQVPSLTSAFHLCKMGDYRALIGVCSPHSLNIINAISMGNE